MEREEGAESELMAANIVGVRRSLKIYEVVNAWNTWDGADDDDGDDDDEDENDDVDHGDDDDKDDEDVDNDDDGMINTETVPFVFETKDHVNDSDTAMPTSRQRCTVSVSLEFLPNSLPFWSERLFTKWMETIFIQIGKLYRELVREGTERLSGRLTWCKDDLT